MKLLAYFLLNLLFLALAAWLSSGRRLTLFLALLSFGVGIGMVNSFIEAVAFGVMPLPNALAAVGGSVLVFALLSAVAVLVSGKAFGGPNSAGQPAITPSRVALVVLAYELLYYSAGILVFPYIEHFYETRRIPPVAVVASLAALRALLFVGWSWPLLRLLPRHAPWLLGIGFAIVGGLAPLIPDNPYMPPDIRFYHAIETGVSNFIFGWVLGWLLQARPGSTEARPASELRENLS